MDETVNKCISTQAKYTALVLTLHRHLLTVYHCWPRLCTLLIANFMLMNPHLQQHDWSKEI